MLSQESWWKFRAKWGTWLIEHMIDPLAAGLPLPLVPLDASPELRQQRLQALVTSVEQRVQADLQIKWDAASDEQRRELRHALRWQWYNTTPWWCVRLP